MFIKKVYKNAFSMSNYKSLEKKSLIKAILYVLILSLVCGIVTIFLGYVDKKDYIQDISKEVYDSIPDFTLSEDGFNIDSEEPITLSLSQVDVYIDSNRDIARLMLEEKGNSEKEIIYIGSDGYSILKGTVINKANYYSNISVLKDVSLNKNDFKDVSEVINLFIRDIFFITGFICVFLFVVFVFIKSLTYSMFIKIIHKYKGNKANFKNIFKITLYANTFYIIYYGVILLSQMNLGFIFKMMIFEVICLINVLYVGLNYKKGGI